MGDLVQAAGQGCLPKTPWEFQVGTLVQVQFGLRAAEPQCHFIWGMAVTWRKWILTHKAAWPPLLLQLSQQGKPRLIQDWAKINLFPSETALPTLNQALWERGKALTSDTYFYCENTLRSQGCQIIPDLCPTPTTERTAESEKGSVFSLPFFPWIEGNLLP